MRLYQRNGLPTNDCIWGYLMNDMTFEEWWRSITRRASFLMKDTEQLCRQAFQAGYEKGFIVGEKETINTPTYCKS